MNDFDEILKNDLKDSVYYLCECRKFYELNDWYNALLMCEEGLKLDAKVVEFYQRAIVCCINIYDAEKAQNFLNKLKEVCFDKDKITPFENLICDNLKENIEKNRNNKDFIKVHDISKKILSNGGNINKVAINTDDPDNRFIYATEDIKNSDVILKIPRSLMITPACIEKTEIGKFFIESKAKEKLDNYDYCIISTFLLSEMPKGKDSNFYFYFNFLPKHYTNFPVFYKETEEKILEDTKFKFLVYNEKLSVKRDFETVQNIVPFMKKVSFDDFLLVRMMISSRLFSFEENNISSCILVPFGDLLNHKKYPDVLWNYDKDDSSFKMTAIKDIKNGTEIFTKYGNKGNENLLLRYGFTIENNVDNAYTFLLKLCNGKKSPEFFTLNVKKNIDDDITKKLFAYLRYMVTDEFIGKSRDNNLPDYVISDEDLKIFYKPQSAMQELKMLRFLNMVIDHYLVDYKFSLDEDLKFFNENKDTMSINEINCWRIRIQEKEILHFYKNFANYCTILFTHLSDSNMVSSLTNSENFDLFKNYINFVLESLK